MGLHRRQVGTPLRDRLAREKTLAEIDLLPAEILDAILAEHERSLPTSRRSLAPIPQALSLALPFPLGVIPPRPGCTRKHRATWERTRSVQRFNHWFHQHGASPHEIARRHGLHGTTLVDHLVGKSQITDDALQRWEAACPGVRTIRDPDPLLYCWRNRIYRWPEMPRTVASQQANLVYPAFLALRAADASHAYAEQCFCRVSAWREELWSFNRTGAPEIDVVIVDSPQRGEPPISMLDAFFRPYWQDAPDVLLARIEADPHAVVADYFDWCRGGPPAPLGGPYGWRRAIEPTPMWVARL